MQRAWHWPKRNAGQCWVRRAGRCEWLRIGNVPKLRRARLVYERANRRPISAGMRPLLRHGKRGAYCTYRPASPAPEGWHAGCRYEGGRMKSQPASHRKCQPVGVRWMRWFAFIHSVRNRLSATLYPLPSASSHALWRRARICMAGKKEDFRKRCSPYFSYMVSSEFHTRHLYASNRSLSISLGGENPSRRKSGYWSWIFNMSEICISIKSYSLRRLLPL